MPGYHFRVDGGLSLGAHLAPRAASGEGRAEKIRCRPFVCNAEGDDISTSAPRLFAELPGDKQYRLFTAAEGAGDHCEAAARTLYHEVSFGWLDSVLHPTA